MKKKYDNKMVESEEIKDQETPVAPVPQKEVWIVCIKECVVPGHGFWKPGDKTSDPFFVARLKDNPNFEEIKEEQTI